MAVELISPLKPKNNNHEKQKIFIPALVLNHTMPFKFGQFICPGKDGHN